MNAFYPALDSVHQDLAFRFQKDEQQAISFCLLLLGKCVAFDGSTPEEKNMVLSSLNEAFSLYLPLLCSSEFDSFTSQ